jgi:hypothetical protein
MVPASLKTVVKRLAALLHSVSPQAGDDRRLAGHILRPRGLPPLGSIQNFHGRNDEPMWSGSKMGAAFCWLRDNGITRFQVFTDIEDREFVIEINDL